LIGRRRATAALAALAVVVAAPTARAGLADRAGNTFALMVGDFVEVFQPVEGLVVQVEGDTVYIDLGSAQAKVGQELTVFRKGDVFMHPVTGRRIGRYEETLGYAQVRRVLPSLSEAGFVPNPGKPPPVPEDGVRITRGRIKVAVTPPLDLTDANADLRRIPYLIATALERSKRFQVVDPLTVGDMLASVSVKVEEVLARPDRAVRVAKNLDVVAWLVPILLERGGTTYLDVTWVSAITGTALFSRRQPLLAPDTAEEQRFPWEPRAED
jgi:hypothetical protein